MCSLQGNSCSQPGQRVEWLHFQPGLLAAGGINATFKMPVCSMGFSEQSSC